MQCPGVLQEVTSHPMIPIKTVLAKVEIECAQLYPSRGIGSWRKVKFVMKNGVVEVQ